jgi:hypothetical protein
MQNLIVLTSKIVATGFLRATTSENGRKLVGRSFGWLVSVSLISAHVGINTEEHHLAGSGKSVLWCVRQSLCIHDGDELQFVYC